jgi:hypothetical protein
VSHSAFGGPYRLRHSSSAFSLDHQFLGSLGFAASGHALEPRSFLDAGTEVLPGVFDAFERGAKYGRACGLAPVAAAGAIRSSEPLQSVRLVTRPRLTAMAGAERFCSRWTLAEYALAAALRQMEKGSVRRLLAHPGEWK